MVKWPFKRLSDLQILDKKATLNHLEVVVTNPDSFIYCSPWKPAIGQNMKAVFQFICTVNGRCRPKRSTTSQKNSEIFWRLAAPPISYLRNTADIPLSICSRCFMVFPNKNKGEKWPVTVTIRRLSYFVRSPFYAFICHWHPGTGKLHHRLYLKFASKMARR